MNILSFLDRRSRLSIWVISITLMLLIGTLDYTTGSEISFSIFYLLPVALAAWTLGRRGGIALALLSTLAWLGAELAHSTTYSSAAIPYWNAGVRLSFFLIVTFTLSALRRAKDRQEEMGHFIVHDLRSPVSNVLTAMVLLLESWGDDLDAEARNLVEVSISSSNRTLTLINSMLDLAKLESGKLVPDQQLIPIQHFGELAAQQVRAMARRGDVQVNVAVDADALACVDQDLTVRILVNLLSNAIKHSPSGSTVTVSAEPTVGNMIAVRVSDQGSGVPAQWRDRVFDRFAQVEVRKAGFAVGSGLGLTFCRLAVEVQGGRIWLESEPGQGTTAVFTLPRTG